MRRSDKPMRTRADTEAAYDAQRRACIHRDGQVCRMEKYVTEVYPMTGTRASVWRECGRKANLMTVHIIRRRSCGKAAAHVDVVIRGCLDCHSAFDGRSYGPGAPFVRIPIERFRRAIETIRENSRETKSLDAQTPYGVYQEFPPGFHDPEFPHLSSQGAA